MQKLKRNIPIMTAMFSDTERHLMSLKTHQRLRNRRTSGDGGRQFQKEKYQGGILSSLDVTLWEAMFAPFAERKLYTITMMSGYCRNTVRIVGRKWDKLYE